MTSDELARGVASYFENEELRKQVVEQLRNEQNSNDAEIENILLCSPNLWRVMYENINCNQ